MISVSWSDLLHILIIVVISTVTFLRGRSAPSGSRPPHTLSKIHDHTHNTQHSAGLLWTSDRPLPFSQRTKNLKYFNSDADINYN